MLSLRNNFLVAISIISYLFITFIVEREAFELLLLCISLCFAAYYFLSKETLNGKQILLIGLVSRIVLLFTFPTLSDDYFRFIWDGKMILEGISPFQYLPSDFIKTTSNTYFQYLFENMNSQNYYSVYPPISQLVYLVSAIQTNTFLSVLTIRIFLIGGDVLAFIYLRKLLNHFKKDESLSLLYFLNPLVILEFSGNLHFEGLMIAFLLVSIHFFLNFKYWQSALFMSLSIGVKLLPLMFIPFFFFKIKGKEKWLFAVLVTVFTIIQFIPFVNFELLEKMMISVNLYFQSFEFNASIYYLLRWLGYQIYGYNVIQTLGIVLGLTSMSTILIISFIQKKKMLFSTLLILVTVYLFLSTTIHPWYLAMPLAFSLFTNYRYMMVWSFLVFVSYSAYQTQVYQENLYLVALEYLLVFGILAYELRKNLRVKKVI